MESQGGEGMSTQAEPKSYWAVMRAQQFTDIETAMGIPLQHPSEGPQRFIPVFDTKEQAVAWNGGDHNVKEMIVTS
jgi:hypothetical protein